MKGGDIERIAILGAGAYGLYYCAKTDKSLIWIILILWLTWVLLVRSFLGGPLLLPEGELFEKPEKPKVIKIVTKKAPAK